MWYRSSRDLLQMLQSGGVSGADDAQVGVVQLVLDELIKKIQFPSRIAPSDSFSSTLMDIYDRTITDTSFSGRSLIADSMKRLAYALLEGVACGGVAIIHRQRSFYFHAEKLPPAELAGRRFASETTARTDYVQFPTAMTLSTPVCTCVFVCVCAEYHN